MPSNVWAVLGLALVSLLGFIGQWAKQGADQSTGAKLQAGKSSELAAVQNAAIAQALVDAPKTQAGVVSDLRSGEF